MWALGLAVASCVGPAHKTKAPFIHHENDDSDDAFPTSHFPIYKLFQKKLIKS